MASRTARGSPAAAAHWPAVGSTWPGSNDVESSGVPWRALAAPEFAAAAEVLAARPSTKVAVSYAWRKDGLVPFRAPFAASPLHGGPNGRGGAVVAAPGAVAVAGASFGFTAEAAGAGLAHALHAPYAAAAARQPCSGAPSAPACKGIVAAKSVALLAPRATASVWWVM